MSVVSRFINRFLNKGVEAPTEAAPSNFSAAARQQADDARREHELELAVLKEQARRSAM